MPSAFAWQMCSIVEMLINNWSALTCQTNNYNCSWMKATHWAYAVFLSPNRKTFIVHLFVSFHFTQIDKYNHNIEGKSHKIA